MAGIFSSQYNDTKVMVNDLDNLSQMNTAIKTDSEGVMKPPKGDKMDAASWWAWLSGYTRQKTQENVERVQEELSGMGVDTTGLSPDYQQSLLEGIEQARSYRRDWGITESLSDKPKWLEQQGDFPIPEQSEVTTEELPPMDEEASLESRLSNIRYVRSDNDGVVDVSPAAEAADQQGLMSRPAPAPEAETPAVAEETTTTPITGTSEAQQKLFDLGYVEVGTVDGIAGPNTSSAVTRYQEQNGLEVTGELDQSTLDSLSGAEADLDTTVQRQIAHHEGQVNYPYKDSRGLWTIGIGHLIGNGSDKALADSGYSQYSAQNPMPESEVADLFDEDLEEHKAIAERYPFYDDMSDEGKRAILDLTFNMGDFYNKKKANGSYEWANLRTQLNNGDWDAAADNLASSAYARQVGRRATTVTNLLRQAGN